MAIKTFLRAVAVAAALSPGLPAAATEIVDQVVAVVDDDVIMASELRERIESITDNLRARGVQLPPQEELIRQTLDRLIIESIQLQKGIRAGIRIPDEQLNEAVQRIAAQNRMTLEQFIEALQQHGQSYDELREQVRREMIIQRVQAGHVNQRIQISEQEVDSFLSSHEGLALSSPEYHVVHALLPISAGAPESEVAAAAAQVDAVLARIRAGEPFADVVAASTQPYTFTGGDLGWRQVDDLPSLFTDIVPRLQPGQTADPLRSDSGFHLVHLLEVRGDSQIITQTKASHILVKPSEILSEDQARELMLELRRRALAGEDFGDLARKYSEDIGSTQEGGDLGWTIPGQTVPAFEAAMAGTPVGEISEPVRTQFGWHIVKVEGRRDQDMSDEAVRGKAMDHVHNRKYQEELDAWLRQIRDEAFVDIK